MEGFLEKLKKVFRWKSKATRGDIGDKIFLGVVRLCSMLILLLAVGFILLLVFYSWQSIQKFGLAFLTGSVWNPVQTEVNPINFGSLPYIYGTIVTSIIALVLALPLGVGGALLISEYAPKWLAHPVAFFVELLVAIPSVAYGLWGLFFLVPVMRSMVEPFLQGTIGKLPLLGKLFDGPVYGQDLLTGGVILAIMILPTILTLTREILRQVPRLNKEGMLALGATKWEVLAKAVLPYAKGGIIGAAMLGLARAIGETMAVTMVVGNSSTKISPSLLTPGYTIASAVANQFTEADTVLYFNAVVELGLVLMLVASLFNIVSRILVNKFTQHPAA